MSTASGGGAGQHGRAGNVESRPMLILAGVIFVIGLLIYFGSGRPLEKTVIGLDGLDLWLGANGVETVETLEPATDNRAGPLRIVPLYDPEPGETGYDATDGMEADRGSLVPRAMSEDAILNKIETGPVLIAMPKWRGGIVDLGRAHPDLLVPAWRVDLFEIGVRRAAVRGFDDYSLSGPASDGSSSEAVTLYSAQVFTENEAFEEHCEPLLILEGHGTLLANCWPDYYDHPVTILSDPDLLNNHGLSLGQNASVALSTLRKLAADGPVFIDNDLEEPYAGDAEGRDPHVRSLADLKRFFTYPFAFFWVGVAIIAGLALWRGGRSFGRPVDDDPNARRGASKRRTIEASKRILLLSGADRDLVATHVDDRIEALASALTGSPTKRGDSNDLLALSRFLSRRAPELSKRLSESQDTARQTGAETSKASQFEALAEFETVIEEIWNEFGRTAHAARQDRR